MPERRLAAYAEAVQLLRAYAGHDPRCAVLHSALASRSCSCGWAEIARKVERLLVVAEGRDECTDCGGSGWKVPTPNEIRRCTCNPERRATINRSTDEAQPARLGGGP